MSTKILNMRSAHMILHETLYPTLHVLFFSSFLYSVLFINAVDSGTHTILSLSLSPTKRDPVLRTHIPRWLKYYTNAQPLLETNSDNANNRKCVLVNQIERIPPISLAFERFFSLENIRIEEYPTLLNSSDSSERKKINFQF